MPTHWKDTDIKCGLSGLDDADRKYVEMRQIKTADPKGYLQSQDFKGSVFATGIRTGDDSLRTWWQGSTPRFSYDGKTITRYDRMPFRKIFVSEDAQAALTERVRERGAAQQQAKRSKLTSFESAVTIYDEASRLSRSFTNNALSGRVFENQLVRKHNCSFTFVDDIHRVFSGMVATGNVSFVWNHFEASHWNKDAATPKSEVVRLVAEATSAFLQVRAEELNRVVTGSTLLLANPFWRSDEMVEYVYDYEASKGKHSRKRKRTDHDDLVASFGLDPDVVTRLMINGLFLIGHDNLKQLMEDAAEEIRGDKAKRPLPYPKTASATIKDLGLLDNSSNIYRPDLAKKIKMYTKIEGVFGAVTSDKAVVKIGGSNDSKGLRLAAAREIFRIVGVDIFSPDAGQRIYRHLNSSDRRDQPLRDKLAVRLSALNTKGVKAEWKAVHGAMKTLATEVGLTLHVVEDDKSDKANSVKKSRVDLPWFAEWLGFGMVDVDGVKRPQYKHTAENKRQFNMYYEAITNK